MVYYHCTYSIVIRYQLDILNLGDHVAIALGARVKILKMILLVLAVMLAGASIAVVGVLVFRSYSTSYCTSTCRP